MLEMVVALTQCCVTGRRQSRRQYAEGENRAEWAVGRRSRLKAHGAAQGCSEEACER